MCVSLAWLCDSLWKGVEAVRLLGVGEGHPHAGRERGVEDDGGALVPGSQVHRWHSANALAVHNHVLGPNAVPASGGKHNVSPSHTLPVYLYPIVQGDVVKSHGVSRWTCSFYCHLVWWGNSVSTFVERRRLTLWHYIIRTLAQPIIFINLISTTCCSKSKHTPVCEASLTHHLLSA